MPTQRIGFVSPNDPILIKIAEIIPANKIISPKTKKDIEYMLDRAYGEQKTRKKPVLVGLAAPQVGISRRIILVDVGADGHGVISNLRVYINPEITWKSEGETEWYEGCFSTDRVCGIVSRPTSIKVKAYTCAGKKIEEEHSGYVARIFQHEIDHLNGKEFVTHIIDESKLHWVEEDEFTQYRDEEAWRTWPKKCSREKWEKIKGISG
jgi:peptide deformylase